MALNRYVVGSDREEEDRLKPASKKGRGSWNEGLCYALLSPGDLGVYVRVLPVIQTLFPGGE